MIGAYNLLFADRGPQVHLIVVGDGPLRPVYERQIDGAARPYVHFAGRLNRTRPNHLVSGDVFCTPCNKASFGMVLLEAMSCGRPVVASRISGFQLLMEHGRQGLMVSPADAADRFAQALESLLADAGERSRMGDQGRLTAVEHYSWPRIAAQLETYYGDLIAGRQPSWANAKSSLVS
jgi:phosphatidylinositol alpha-mannosyltransferase